MKQGKYIVVDGKYVHSSKVVSKVNPRAQLLCAMCVALLVVVFGYMASFCI